MPGVQCVICLSSDTSAEEWCVLKDCGHVFHTHCVMQSLEHSKRCPQCRTDYKKYRSNNPPYQRLFFEFSDEPGSQPLPGSTSFDGGGGDGAIDVSRLAFLESQLREKDRRIQAVGGQLVEAEERVQRLERDLELARSGLREREGRLQEKIAELAREHKQVKGLANQVANLTSQLRSESSKASLLALATDHTLAGPALSAEVDKLVRLGLKAPNDFWEKLMSERSAVIMANSNKHAREKAALERAVAAAQAEVGSLQEQVTSLKQSLAAARQQQLGAGMAAAGSLQAATGQHPAPRGGFGSSAYGTSAKPGALRHGVRRLGTAAGGSSAGTAVAEEEDPLVHSYDVLGMRVGDLPDSSSLRRRQPQQQQQQQHRQPPQQQQQRRPGHGHGSASAAAAVAAAGAAPRSAAAAAAEQEVELLGGSRAGAGADGAGDVVDLDFGEDHAVEDEDEEGVVVLDGSEEQEVLLEDEDEEAAAGCYSEIESDDGGMEEDRPQQQQQQPPAAVLAQQQQQPEQRPEQRQAGRVLGKRPALQLGSWPASRPGSSQSQPPADENWPGSSASAPAPTRPAPLLAAAGPARMAVQQGPGRTFIRNTAAASVGIDRGKYISSGPDGKGGVATAYQGGGGGASVRLSQKQLDGRTLQQAGGSKKARSGSGSLDRGAARALQQNNLPISMYFSRQQQQK